MKSITIALSLFLFTACAQEPLKTPAGAVTKFEAFMKKEKFLPDDRLLYPGINEPELKPVLSEKINLAADDFKKLAESGNATAKAYQNCIKKGLERFSDIYLRLDTEDRERICTYFEELMDIAGLESSGGHLNDFMYNFNPVKSK